MQKKTVVAFNFFSKSLKILGNKFFFIFARLFVVKRGFTYSLRFCLEFYFGVLVFSAAGAKKRLQLTFTGGCSSNISASDFRGNLKL